MICKGVMNKVKQFFGELIFGKLWFVFQLWMRILFESRSVRILFPTRLLVQYVFHVLKLFVWNINEKILLRTQKCLKYFTEPHPPTCLEDLPKELTGGVKFWRSNWNILESSYPTPHPGYFICKGVVVFIFRGNFRIVFSVIGFKKRLKQVPRGTAILVLF